MTKHHMVNICVTRLARSGLVIFCMLTTACPLFMSPLPTIDADAGPGYYSKTLTYYRYIDPAELFYESVEVQIYDRQGKLSGIYVHSYEPYPSTDHWLLMKTDFFAVTDAGVKVFTERYTYSYKPHSYTNSSEGTVTEYVLIKGEGFTGDGSKVSEYEVVYLEPLDQPCVYLTVSHYVIDSSGRREVARDESKYRLINGKYYFVTEKNFVADASGSGLELSKEFATWYTVLPDGQVRYTHDLYHTKRSDSTGSTEAWFYTKYDWNEAGRVFAQQDFIYDKTTVATLADGTIDPWITIPKTAVNDIGGFNAFYSVYNAQAFLPVLSFTMPGDYPLSYMYSLSLAYIGGLNETLTKRYDDKGNVVEKVRSSQGQEFERIVYRYDGDAVVSMIRYMNGRSYAHDRTETRYYSETRNGVPHDVAEEHVYRSYESDQTRGLAEAPRLITAGGSADSEALRGGNHYYFRIRRNHDR